MIVVVRAREEHWRALLAALPKCAACGHVAEVKLTEPGATYTVCMACATQRPKGRAEPLDHAGAATAIEDQLLGV